MAIHLTHYTKAMACIQDHGCFAAITKDGLLAIAMDMPGIDIGPDDDDIWCDMPTVFEVTSEGMVESRAVREWLGY